MLGGMAATVMPVYIPLVIQSRSRIRSILWLIAAGLNGLSVLISTSYGAWLAVLWRRRRLGCVARSGLGGRVAAESQFKTRGERFLRLVPCSRCLDWRCCRRCAGRATRSIAGTIRLSDRIRLPRESLPLARDYLWTGCRPGNVPITVLDLHSAHSCALTRPTSHNVLVDLW